MSYLQQFLDPGLKVDPADTAKTLAAAEQERLLKLYTVAITAMHIPRRLGKEADDAELSYDRQACRRIAHVAEQSLKAWGGKLKDTGGVEREASQVNWARWFQDHQVYLRNRMRYIATWQYSTGSDERWAKGAVVRLNNELDWLQYALRDDRRAA